MKRFLFSLFLSLCFLFTHASYSFAENANPEAVHEIQQNNSESTSSEKDGEPGSESEIVPEQHLLELDVSDALEWQSELSAAEHPRVPDLEFEKSEDVYFYYTPDYLTRAQDVIRSIKSAQEKTLDYLPRDFVTNIHVYLLADINRYFDAIGSRGRAPDWAAGLAILQDGVILIRLTPNGASKIEPERTLAHELNHIALRRYTKGHFVPHWLYEGFAIVATEKWGEERAKSLSQAAMTNQLLSFDDITNGFPPHGATVNLAYAQSGNFVGWLINVYGKEAFRNWLKAIADGTEYRQAFEQAYGVPLSGAEKRWHDGIVVKDAWFAPLMSPEALFFFVSVLGIAALVVVRLRRRRKHAPKNPSENVLPKNLRHFGPFMK